LHTKFSDAAISHSGDMTAGIKIKNRSCYPDHTLFSRGFVIHDLGFDTVYLFAKLDECSLSRSRYIIGAPILKVGHMILTMPL